MAQAMLILKLQDAADRRATGSPLEALVIRWAVAEGIDLSKSKERKYNKWWVGAPTHKQRWGSLDVEP